MHKRYKIHFASEKKDDHSKDFVHHASNGPPSANPGKGSYYKRAQHFHKNDLLDEELMELVNDAGKLKLNT